MYCVRSPGRGFKSKWPSDEPHLHVWRNHVQVISLHAHAVGDLKDRHRRVTREERRQCAFVLRRQMLDEDEGEAGLRRQCADHAREGLEATGRCADSDDRDPVGVSSLRLEST